jgi:hypothetical protein
MSTSEKDYIYSAELDGYLFIYLCVYLFAANQTGRPATSIQMLFCFLLFVNPKKTSIAAKWLRHLFLLGRPAIQNADRRKDKMADFSDCRQCQCTASLFPVPALSLFSLSFDVAGVVIGCKHRQVDEPNCVQCR